MKEHFETEQNDPDIFSHCDQKSNFYMQQLSLKPHFHPSRRSMVVFNQRVTIPFCFEFNFPFPLV